jgi:hypothetical protein
MKENCYQSVEEIIQVYGWECVLCVFSRICEDLSADVGKIEILQKIREWDNLYHV